MEQFPRGHHEQQQYPKQNHIKTMHWLCEAWADAFNYGAF